MWCPCVIVSQASSHWRSSLRVPKVTPPSWGYSSVTPAAPPSSETKPPNQTCMKVFISLFQLVFLFSWKTAASAEAQFFLMKDMHIQNGTKNHSLTKPSLLLTSLVCFSLLRSELKGQPCARPHLLSGPRSMPWQPDIHYLEEHEDSSSLGIVHVLPCLSFQLRPDSISKCTNPYWMLCPLSLSMQPVMKNAREVKRKKRKSLEFYTQTFRSSSPQQY